MSGYLMHESSAIMLVGGLVCLLFVGVLILLAASLFKYLFGTALSTKTGVNSDA